MSKATKKIGIMGGTFDPIHMGHLILGEKAYEQLELDKVLFMPCGNPPHKRNRKGRATDEQRAEMVADDLEGGGEAVAFAFQRRELFVDVRHLAGQCQHPARHQQGKLFPSEPIGRDALLAHFPQPLADDA